MVGAYHFSGALLDPLPAFVGGGEIPLIDTDDILSHPTERARKRRALALVRNRMPGQQIVRCNN